VRVLKLGCELDLASEPLDVDTGGELREKDLHYDLAPQRLFMCHENA
jgi:hypothetical protein